MKFSNNPIRRALWAILHIVLALEIFPPPSLCQGKTTGDIPSLVKLTEEGSRWAEQTLRELSLEEKVGQMLQVRYYADNTDFESSEYRHLREELQKYAVGSVILGMHFSHEGPVRGSAVDAAKIANQLQQDSHLPLLLAADIERGVASRLRDVPSFPWPMAFGAAEDPSQVERFAAISAREARSVGINWALGPVADVNSNAANPVINTRSFGEDSDQVGMLVSKFIRGAHENGLLVTAKHFPGNGNISADSHQKLATIEGDLTHLQRIELPPFKRAIDAGVDSIMLAHASVPAIDPDPKKIATVSTKVVTDLLKANLGFKGIIITDALEMQGLIRLYDPKGGSPTARAVVDAIKAGCDVIQLPADLDGAFHGVIDAVRKGEIPEARINESVRKILQAKAALGLNRNRFVDVSQVVHLTNKQEDFDFAQHIADQAVTLVRDNKKVLPLQPSRTANTFRGNEIKLVVVLLDEAFTSTDGKEFEKSLLARRRDAKVFYFDNRTDAIVSTDVMKSVAEAEHVVLAVYVKHDGVRHIVADGKLLSSFGPLGPAGHLLEQIVMTAPEKTAVIALGSPYLIVNYPEIKTYLCTYSQASTSELSAVKAIFGEIQNHAKLPVTLPGIAPRGFSLPWPKETTPARDAAKSSR